jgi:hypothetical protein
MPRFNSAFAGAKNCDPSQTEGALINSPASFVLFISCRRANSFRFEDLRP